MRIWWIAAAALIAAYIGYPYLTLYWIDQALLTDDSKALQRLVDFSRIREQLKADLKVEVLDKAHEETKERPVLGVFGAALAGLVAPPLIDSSVDQFITPEAILNSEPVVEHRRKQESFADFVTYAFFSAPTRFRVDLKDPEKTDSPTITTQMELVGPKWRIVAVELPPVDTWFGKRPE
jgi:hypothetical protein